jgi:6-pyruvoyl-tetrahydropterin synthase
MAYRITITGLFHATHALRLSHGRLEPRHAHHWRVTVTVAAARLNRIEVVMDFHLLERQLAQVLAGWEGRDLNRTPPFAAAGGRPALNASAERVAWWVGRRLMPGLPAGVYLAGVEVEEEPGCIACFVPGPGRTRRSPAKRSGGAPRRK